jgi:hypothetical protein
MGCPLSYAGPAARRDGSRLHRDSAHAAGNMGLRVSTTTKYRYSRSLLDQRPRPPLYNEITLRTGVKCYDKA